MSYLIKIIASNVSCDVIVELVLPLFAFYEVGAWPLEVDAQCQNLILLLTQFLFHLANHSFLYDINFLLFLSCILD